MKYDIESINKRKKNMKYIKIIIGIILVIMIYNMVLLLISSDKLDGTISLFGYKAFIITSNSMEPNIHLGDAVVTRKCKQKDLEVGDIVTYKQNYEYVTHRIIKVEEKNQEGETIYITKGDNNNLEDSEKVGYSKIIGKKVLIIPYLGKVVEILDNKMIGLIIILILLVLSFYIIQREEKMENRREKRRIEQAKENK